MPLHIGYDDGLSIEEMSVVLEGTLDFSFLERALGESIDCPVPLRRCKLAEKSKSV